MDMIIKKPVSEGSIVSFRLVSGEEVCGKLTENGANTFVISKPIIIALQMTQTGPGIAFVPYMASLDDSGSFTFKHAHVINTLALTRSDVANSYIQATTGIEIAQTF